ncbi:hypothetical protein TpMuguga_03g00820 [Theileria parva strain Muguga]|uniref:Uncharacterized protein n=1 Tax=Theileria parva TaxID=5875 RepID=Q4MYM1_THEPA|nr:uncharacterized protein TpMuguga_03g00820 [Theileria parva strain Muguga]EAN30661.1 hypothetical protein TpMuguga_03g00820 [Theileria parva strain Muguga]|eukprot:XP_762944.1 hypothetical protein [Theileria parva strain Muguga]
MDIISMRVLRSLKLTQRENEIYRIIKSILKSEGFIERVYGPQLPTSSHHSVRDLDDLTGVGYNTQLNMEVDTMEDGGRLCWITSENDRDQLSIPSMPLGIREGEYKRYHEYDREEDLMDIKNYYKEFYKLIVKPLQDFKPQTEQDLLYQYAKPLEFISTNTEREHIFNTVNNHSVNSKNSNSKNLVIEYKNNYKGREVKNYEFTRELLNKFKIKQKSNQTNVTPRFTVESTGESVKLEEEIKLPNELYKNLFAKL